MVIRYIILTLCISGIHSLNGSESEDIQTPHVDELGNTELHYAMRRGVTAHPSARYKHIDAICKLLYEDASLNQENNEGKTPLELATHHTVSGGYGLPLITSETELYFKGKFSSLYVAWLKKHHPKELPSWFEEYKNFKNDEEHAHQKKDSDSVEQELPLIMRHKRVKSGDTKKTASAPSSSITSPAQTPTIAISYEN